MIRSMYSLSTALGIAAAYAVGAVAWLEAGLRTGLDTALTTPAGWLAAGSLLGAWCVVAQVSWRAKRA